VGEHHALGEPRRAARVRQRRHVLAGIDVHGRRIIVLGKQRRERRGGVRLTEHEQLAQSQLAGRLLGFGDARRHGQEVPRA
jgi:hypothetical protein